VALLGPVIALLLLVVACTGRQPRSGSAASASSPSGSSSTSVTVSPLPSTSRSVLPIRYLVAPHPDDEFAIWSMAQDPAHFPVLMVLTHGERANACAGTGLQASIGERVPSPQPFAGRLTPTCDAERIDSLVAFLTSVGAVDKRWSGLVEQPPRTAPSDPTPRRCDTPTSCRPATSYRVWKAAGAVLLVFDLGDHDLTVPEVVWAVRTARSQRTSFAASGTEDDIVGMGYENSADAAFAPYDHPDQQAVAAAMTTVDLGLPGPQWSRTYPTDPGRVSTLEVDPALFAALTAVEPGPVDPVRNTNARRVGGLQVDYGWLAFPDAYWFAEEQPIHSFYSRSQDFTKSY
jgi:hypothetical protein